MARVHVEVFGCSSNVADSEIVAGLLSEAGHSIVAMPEDADATVVLTCIVKTPTERRVVKRLKELSAKGRPLVVAGCMPQVEGRLVKDVASSASMLGPNDLPRVAEVLEAALRGMRVEAIDGNRPDRTCLPRMRRSPVIHIAPIASGCLGDCSYCIVKRARGRLHSFPADGIVEDAKKAIEQGCREIWVTAEDTAAYRWGSARLPQLLRELIAIEGNFYVRIGMMTPNQADPIAKELIDVYRSDKVFKFLHVPIQSGNDEVLHGMRRRYTVADFKELVSRFRTEFPRSSLSTDIICGFPGETNEQFEDSVRLVEEIRPEVLNISRFWPRPGTEAEGMVGQIHGRETKARSRELTLLWRKISMEENRRWVDWRGEVLIDEQGQAGGSMGRNYAYKPVALTTSGRLGDFVGVTVDEARVGYLLGKVIDPSLT